MEIIGICLWAIITIMFIYAWLKRNEVLRSLVVVLYFMLMLFLVFVM